jgi:hypothetical protein
LTAITTATATRITAEGANESGSTRAVTDTSIYPSLRARSRRARLINILCPGA